MLPAIDNIKFDTFEVQQYASAAHGYNWGLWCMYIVPPQDWLDRGDEAAPIRWAAVGPRAGGGGSAGRGGGDAPLQKQQVRPGVRWEAGEGNGSGGLALVCEPGSDQVWWGEEDRRTDGDGVERGRHRHRLDPEPPQPTPPIGPLPAKHLF